VELQEIRYPFVVETHALREDSGGAGRYRGGHGVALAYRCLTSCQVNINFERTKTPPWGLHGGADGQTNYAIITRADGRPDEKVLKGTQIPLQPGDVVIFYTAGGGGYGDPGKRAREAIVSDLAEGLVSKEAARRDYGLSS
jgi:N-methylhydantoinase B